MGRVIRIAGEEQEAVSMATLRLIAGLEPDEFAAALSREVGYPVSAYVYLGWEEGAATPPQAVTAAARRLATEAARSPRAGSSTMSRRHFLGGIATVTAAAMSGLNPRAVTGPELLGRSDGHRRISPDGAADLEALVGDYRRSYASRRTVSDLLPGATGLTRTFQ
jgi:hypothetical protein